LRAQGVPAQSADLQAKKIAAVQINKQHQLIFQKTLIVRRAYYLKMKVPPAQAMIMAKKDANRAALYNGKEEEIRQAVMNEVAEERAAVDEAKRMQEAEYSNTYAGQASAVMNSLWSWGAGEEEDDGGGKKSKKKKKGKKKDLEEGKGDGDTAATAAPALPPQLQNLTPQQLAAVRAMQQRQLAARQAPPTTKEEESSD